MVSVGETIGQFTGGVSFGGFLGPFMIFIYIMIIAVVVGVVTYWIVIASKFNQKISVYESINGKMIHTRSDKARVVKVGDGGEVILQLKKHKLYRHAYGEKIGRNHFAFAIGDDGYWYNFKFGDFDKAKKELGIEPVDKDMRMMHVAIRKNIKDRYEKVTFLQKYGGLLAYTALIAVTGIMMFLLFDKFLDISSTVNGAVQLSKEVTEETARLIGALDSFSSSSGVRSA